MCVRHAHVSPIVLLVSLEGKQYACTILKEVILEF